jgi:hypothetical protein
MLPHVAVSSPDTPGGHVTVVPGDGMTTLPAVKVVAGVGGVVDILYLTPSFFIQ